MILRSLYNNWISPQRWMERAGLRAPMQITIGLVMLTVCALCLSKNLGLLPGQADEELRERELIAQVVSIQAASAISRQNFTVTKDLLTSLVKLNHGVLSACLRRTDGSVAVQTSDHPRLWEGADPNNSTPTHMQIALLEGDRPWGRMEIVFAAPTTISTWMNSWSNRAIQMIIFVAGSVFLLFWFFLSRMLTMLDPSAVIPDRMQLLMDTLVEGMVILDPDGRIVMTNQAFALTAFTSVEHLIGKRLSSLPWETAQRNCSFELFPWETEQSNDLQQRGVGMHLKVGTTHSRRLTVNVSPILDSDAIHVGKIITFDDQTVIEEDNDHLAQIVSNFGSAITQIRESRGSSPSIAKDPLDKLDELANAAVDLTRRCRSAIGGGQDADECKTIARSLIPESQASGGQSSRVNGLIDGNFHPTDVSNSDRNGVDLTRS